MSRSQLDPFSGLFEESLENAIVSSQEAFD